MSLERRLASLNISQNRVPVAPPRSKKIQKRLYSLPDKMAVSPTKSHELYNGEKSYSFDENTRYISSDGNLRYNDGTDYDGYKRSQHPSYHKYEVPRKDHRKDSTQKHAADVQPMCDIIQSSQQTSSKAMWRRPDILRGSFKADIQSKYGDIPQPDSHHAKPIQDKDRVSIRPNHFDDNKNIVHSAGRLKTKAAKQSINQHDSPPSGTSSSRSKKVSQPSRSMRQPNAASTPKDKSNNRFMFYRPKADKLQRQNGMAEVSYKGGSLVPSPEGSFVNPAFDIVDTPKKDTAPKAPAPVKPVPIPPKLSYSTMGSSFSTRPCTPSPPSLRFRNQKPPLPSSPEPKISPTKLLGPSPIKPMLSAKQLENSLKQYSSQSRLDTLDMCSPQALDSMMKYYKMRDSDSQSDSPTPPPSQLSSAKKNQSPYSSTGSLNVSGDSIDVVLRRKKKVSTHPSITVMFLISSGLCVYEPN